jgi:hypothetical protein
MKLEVKKTIALSLTALFVVVSLYGFIVGKTMMSEITPIVTLVIGYYFGKGHTDIKS